MDILWFVLISVMCFAVSEIAIEWNHTRMKRWKGRHRK